MKVFNIHTYIIIWRQCLFLLEPFQKKGKLVNSSAHKTKTNDISGKEQLFGLIILDRDFP